MRSRLWPRHEAVACRDVVELLTAYLEGALPPSAAALLRTHLEGCDGCQVYLEQLRATVRTLGATPLPTLSEQACRELLAAFRAQSSAPGTSP